MVFTSLRPYLIPRRDLGIARAGALLIFRSSWALARRAAELTVALVNKIRTSESADAAGDEPDGGKAEKAPAKGKKAKKGGKGTGKSISVDTLIGGAIITGMGVLFVVNTLAPLAANTVTDLAAWVIAHPGPVLRAAGCFLVVFVPVAWVVGRAAAEEDDTATKPGAATEQPPVNEAPEDQGEALLRHVVQAMADTEATRHTGLHLDVILASALLGGLVPRDTEVPELKQWVEACGLPVETKFGRRVEGKSVTRPGLRVDAVTKALGRSPAAWLQARSEAPAEGPTSTPVRPPEEPSSTPLDKTPEAPVLRVI
ncbi:hypothetical protein ACWCXX_06295 [Streptomyces sp. NPDC001732]